MEFFVTLVNGSKLPPIATKGFSLNVAMGFSLMRLYEIPIKINLKLIKADLFLHIGLVITAFNNLETLNKKP